MLSAIVLSLTLSIVSADNQTPPPKNYTFDTSGTTREVQAGKKGELKVHIKGTDGYKVSAEAPLKIALEAKDLELAKKQLGHDDAKEKKSTSPEFTVSFAAAAAGDKSITVDAMFFVCSEKICEKKTEKVTIPVSVRP